MVASNAFIITEMEKKAEEKGIEKRPNNLFEYFFRSISYKLLGCFK
ncbi:MAG: hypothetical protein H7Y18_05875 [Clostridiaceae bacterium]|nr:hypothetical protein [Clostridiaceae bacterium]